MNIIISYNKAHQIFFEKYFMPSFKDKFKLYVSKIDHDDEMKISNFSGNKWNHDKIFNFYECKRIEFIISILKENLDDIFFYLDVDIQFLQPIETEVFDLINDKDLLFLKGGSKGINLGGIVIKSNSKTINFFQRFRDLCIKDNHKRGIQKILKDSKLLNDHPQNPILENDFLLKWDYLPEKKFSCGHMVSYSSKFRLWKKIPESIMLHHANGTTGKDNKIAQLEYVKQNYKNISNIFYKMKRLKDSMIFYIKRKELLYSKYES